MFVRYEFLTMQVGTQNGGRKKRLREHNSCSGNVVLTPRSCLQQCVVWAGEVGHHTSSTEKDKDPRIYCRNLRTLSSAQQRLWQDDGCVAYIQSRSVPLGFSISLQVRDGTSAAAVCIII